MAHGICPEMPTDFDWWPGPCTTDAVSKSFRSQTLSDIQKPIDIIPDIPYALESAKKSANPNDLICITGSIYTVSEAKQFLENDPVA